jgi:phage pi2 protein 07
MTLHLNIHVTVLYQSYLSIDRRHAENKRMFAGIVATNQQDLSQIPLKNRLVGNCKRVVLHPCIEEKMLVEDGLYVYYQKKKIRKRVQGKLVISAMDYNPPCTYITCIDYY